MRALVTASFDPAARTDRTHWSAASHPAIIDGDTGSGVTAAICSRIVRIAGLLGADSGVANSVMT